MKKSRLSASSLRIILTVCIFLMVALTAVGFYFAQNWLRTLAIDASHTVADSTTSGDNIQSLQKLQQELEAKQSINVKVNSLITNSQEYQNQAIRDVKKYASDSGITISNYGFGGAAAAAPVATTPGAKAAAVTPTTNPTITLKIDSPLSYERLLKFMNLIENNLPKMQISNITLTRVGSGSDTIAADTLTVEVYTQ
jgi:hypothetical protein